MIIKTTTWAIRRKPGNSPTFEQERELIALLDLRVELPNEAGERRLYLTCEHGRNSAGAGSQSYGYIFSSKWGYNHNRVIVFSAVLRLDAQNAKLAA
jgi:hypothetical protein